MNTRFRAAVKFLFERLGYEIHHKPDPAALRQAPLLRNTGQAPFYDGLAHIQRLGFCPATVLDVGAAHGEFTRTCRPLFPDARYLIVEPLAEFRPGLERLAQEVPDSTFEHVAAGKGDGTATLHVHRDWDGSSLYRETEGAQVDGSERVVPLLAEVVRFMGEHSFAAYDISAPLYRPLDGALSQVDLAFVREDGRFRKHHIYASPRQRAAQDREFDDLQILYRQDS